MPVKRVFVTRIKGHQPSDAIRDHLATHLSDYSVDDYRVEKVNLPENRPYSSFIIHAGHDDVLFKSLLDRIIWPSGTMVKEFFLRKSTKNKEH